MAVSPIELGLTRPLTPDDSVLVRLVDQLLELVSEQAADSETLNTSAFRQRLLGYREAIRSGGQSEVVRTAIDCVSTCREFFRRSAVFTAERDAEITGLIETLTTAINQLAGEAATVNQQLTSHTERFNRLVEIEDIRDLKRRISQEVTALNRFVSEKHEREEAYYSKLTKKIEVLQARLIETEETASLDALTQIANRGTFDRTLTRWLKGGGKAGRPFVLTLLDIDNFKRVNDTFGHLVGDRVLLAAARSLASQMRAGDLVARFGGEEFALLMADMTLRQAEPRLRQILQTIAAGVYEFEHQGHVERLSYTVSAGAAESAADDTTDTIVKRADEGLYEAKNRGKNCVVARKHSILSRILGA
jgi:diguanylate cyclase